MIYWKSFWLLRDSKNHHLYEQGDAINGHWLQDLCPRTPPASFWNPVSVHTDRHRYKYITPTVPVTQMATENMLPSRAPTYKTPTKHKPRKNSLFSSWAARGRSAPGKQCRDRNFPGWQAKMHLWIPQNWSDTPTCVPTSSAFLHLSYTTDPQVCFLTRIKAQVYL